MTQANIYASASTDVRNQQPILIDLGSGSGLQSAGNLKCPEMARPLQDTMKTVHAILAGMWSHFPPLGHLSHRS